MNTLKINNKVVNLPASFTLPINLNSPIFDKDAFSGEYSLPVTLNLDISTVKAIGIEYLPNSEAMTTSFDAKLTIAGKEMLCNFNILKYIKTGDSVKISAQFLFNASSVAKKINTAKLQELPLEVINIPYVYPLVQASMWANHAAAFLATVNSPDSHNYVVAPLINETFRDGVTIEETWQNQWDPASDTHDFTIRSPRENYWTPFVYVRHILSSIARLLDLQEDLGVFVTDTEIKRLVVYNNFDIFKETKDAGQSFFAPDENIKLANHVPDVSISDFILNLKKKFNLFVDFDFQNSKLTINTLDSIMNSFSFTDWTNKASANYEIEKIYDNKNLQLVRENDTRDENYSNEAQTKYPTKDPLNSEAINFNISAPTGSVKLSSTGVNSDLLLAPSVKQKGSDMPDIREYGVKIMFYRGKVAIPFIPVTTHQYPFLGINAKNQDLQDTYIHSLNIGPDLTLSVNPSNNTSIDKGIYKQFHKNWWSFYSKHRQLTLKIPLTAAEIFELDWTRKIRIHNSLFFIKSIKGNIGKAIENVMSVELVKYEN